MGDKNPKHPMKKKKQSAKVGVPHQDAENSESSVNVSGKKKHIYQ